MPQYSITMSVGSIVALEPYEFLGEIYNTDLANFAINNFIHVKMDDDIYKLRIASIELSYPMSDKISVSFTNAERFINGFSSDIASILASAQSMATSFTYVATQANQGASAKASFDYVKQQGLDTSLMAIKGGRNQDIVIDDTGILLRMLNEYTNEYDPHQMKMINNEIVMTDDNWRTARLAIGLTLNPRWTEGIADKDEPQYLYGVYADAIVGDIIVGKRIRRIGNASENDLCTVEINRNGIEISNGLIDIFDSQYDNRAIINPCGMAKPTVDLNNGAKPNLPRCNKDFPSLPTPEYKDLLYYGQVKGQPQFWVTRTGDAFFAGTLVTKRGRIANWYIDKDCLYTEENRGDFTNTAGMYFGKEGIRIGKNFYVKKNGDAYFAGTIEAKAGHIGYWKIGSMDGTAEHAYICSDNYNAVSLEALASDNPFDLFPANKTGQYFGWQGLIIGKKFYVRPDGTLFAKDGKFEGSITATSGKIGCFNINSAGYLYTDSWAYSPKGLGYDTDGICISDNFIIAAEDYKKGKGTYIGSNGYIKTSRLAIYGIDGWFQTPSRNATGVTFDVVPGGFDSRGSATKPYQLKINGADPSGIDVQDAFIGIFQQGRMIIGLKDFGNPDDSNSAYKLNVDGSMYIAGKIHFGNGNNGERYVLKLVHDKGDEYTVKAIKKSNGVSVKQWNESTRKWS